MDQYFCALCGGPFSVPERTRAGPADPDKDARTLVEGDEDFEYTYDGERVAKEELMWLVRLRVLAPYYDQREYPTGMRVRDGYWVSGVGVECSLNTATVPYLYDDVENEDDLDARDKDGVAEAIDVYGDPDDRAPRALWAYPFHDGCFQILEAALAFAEDQPGAPTRIPWSVVHHVFGTHCEAEGGVDCALQLDYGHTCIEQYWTVNRGEERYVSDPINVPALRELLTNPPPLAAASTPPPKLGHINTKSDAFARLPAELLFQVLSYLPDAAVAALRLASRAVASLALDASQAFWRARIAYLPCVLPADLEWTKGKGGDWREVYRILRVGEVEALGFTNRRRVWGICMGVVREAAELVKGGFVPEDVRMCERDGGSEGGHQYAGEHGSGGEDESEQGNESEAEDGDDALEG
ncbi:hypothetical protein GLOTRDRAFT_139988 [Gloeophyllum trabeum ATCC 11539]|uniref:F-box domain-containing protein n=1 Tax=Gloeophyllum trabeum (strain ATCC 11539 / FP-39264 / Madison 617) TaxID=670483 RepID=S7RK81_GLOTA|nr:uncharacterized protein GLOTRDRAFT_139988 [Gloeophyllum trabeum ATCC 11539]EPQ53039.1 hypothetical protein GLOTRDRAFT_139988 [Gloeophyllum trabeum ATCC 11539]